MSCRTCQHCGAPGEARRLGTAELQWQATLCARCLREETARPWAQAMWMAWRAGEAGWKVEDDTDEGVAWIARSITADDQRRYRALTQGRWMFIHVDEGKVHGAIWLNEPGGLAPKGAQFGRPNPEDDLPAW